MAEPDVDLSLDETVVPAMTEVDILQPGNETAAGTCQVTAEFRECLALRVAHELQPPAPVCAAETAVESNQR